MARNLENGLNSGLRRSIARGLGSGDIFTLAPLDLRFAQQKTLDSRITFTRASSGTYVGSDGLIKTATTNEARFDHNPTTRESLGLLVEEQRTNLALNTVLAGGTTPTSWSLGSTGVPTVASSIYGNSDGGIALSFATNADRNYITQTVALAANTTYVFSVLVESVINYPSTNANVVSLNNAPAGSTITGASGNPAVGQRITTTIAVGATAGNVQIRIGLGVGSNATGTIILSRPQLEAGSFPTSYIPTTTATATRSADVASITGVNFSSWYNQTTGTIFAEYRTSASGTRGVVGFNDNTANERIAFYTSGADPKLTVVDGGVTQADINGGTVTASVMTKSAGAFAVNDFALAHAGGAAVTDTNGTMPTPDRVLIGADQAGNYQNGRIRRLTYWPSRLPNSTLQEITR